MKTGVKRIAAGIIAVSLILVASFAIGGTATAKQPPPGPTTGAMRVTCLDWYHNKGNTQWHVEAHVKDANGNGVIGAVVTVDQFKNGVFVQTRYGTTYAGDGVGNGSTCGTNVANAVSPDFCIGSRNGPGVYTATVKSVTKAGWTWDGETPANSYTRV